MAIRESLSVGRRQASAQKLRADVIIRRGAEEAASAFPPLLAEAERLARTVTAGLHGRKRAGPGETFWQHRPYGFGDAASAIDWRQSARAGDRLYVRQNEWEAAAPVWIWRDPSRSLDYRSTIAVPEKSQRADILATALTILLAEAGERIGLIAASRQMVPAPKGASMKAAPNGASMKVAPNGASMKGAPKGASMKAAQPPMRMRSYHGRAAPQRILEALLSENHAPEGRAASPIADTGPGASVVLLSDFYFDPAAQGEALMTFASQGARGVLLQIVDPAEEDFPFAGRVEFQDTESADRLTLGSANARAADYRRAFAAHRAGLADIAARVGWRFIVHRTDAPATSALMGLYAAVARTHL